MRALTPGARHRVSQVSPLPVLHRLVVPPPTAWWARSSLWPLRQRDRRVSGFAT